MNGRISEIFDSVQGEGIYFGEKQLFVRFFGCNLSCRFCDTKLDRFTEYEPRELLEEIRLYKDKQDSFESISFTGGEPLLQAGFLQEVLKLTSGHGYKNYLETNGTLPGELSEVIDYLHTVAMDLKLPSSSGMPQLWPMHRRFLKTASRKDVFIKAVICGTTSEDDIRQAAELILEADRSAILVLQPNSFEKISALTERLGQFKDYCVGRGVITCVIPQLHKKIGLR
ncbi:MAG: hypothetical protein A3G38_04565 [Omnitrophica WOR_2 bacterium RIFCSPLOWO2_12_FULL_51_8]|nr:MAG: hypothetical protein A3G38_04565 [Omnitrophica WOR_2 bacterium RIFCSPLOWO2_12_FULL_51_8]